MLPTRASTYHKPQAALARARYSYGIWLLEGSLSPCIYLRTELNLDASHGPD